MERFIISNLIEAGVWIVVGIGMGVLSTRLEKPYKNIVAVVAIASAVIGMGDIVEAFTGSMWQAWWLILWNGGAMGALSFSLVWFVREWFFKR
jgi:hypothetical protein